MEPITITARNFARIMEEQVEPFLAQHRSEGFVIAKDGAHIHYEAYIRPDSVGGVVISHGFTEAAEKFREVSYRFYARGYSVFAIDHRGHGRSDRAVDGYYLTHVDKFADYVDDFERFIDQVALPNNGAKPLYLYAHSMGGAIGALFLSRRPEVFARAVLTAPMIQPVTRPVPRRMGQAMGAAMCALGRGKRRVAHYPGAFNPQESFEKSCDTCRERFDYYLKKRVATPQLQNGAPTYSWARQAMGVTDTLLKPENAARIACPVLLLQADGDHVVEPEAQRRFVALLKQGELVRMENCKHEIYMSTDDVLETYYRRIFDFLEK